LSGSEQTGAVTFINPLTVPASREQEFLEKWDEGAAYVSICEGFVSTSLQRSLNPSAPFNYFTIAVWNSADEYYRAVSTDWWRDFVAAFGFGAGPDDFGARPTLCEQVRP